MRVRSSMLAISRVPRPGCQAEAKGIHFQSHAATPQRRTHEISFSASCLHAVECRQKPLTAQLGSSRTQQRAELRPEDRVLPEPQRCISGRSKG